MDCLSDVGILAAEFVLHVDYKNCGTSACGAGPLQVDLFVAWMGIWREPKSRFEKIANVKCIIRRKSLSTESFSNAGEVREIALWIRITKAEN